jgi:hypothetical protein
MSFLVAQSLNNIPGVIRFNLIILKFTDHNILHLANLLNFLSLRKKPNRTNKLS